MKEERREEGCVHLVEGRGGKASVTGNDRASKTLTYLSPVGTEITGWARKQVLEYWSTDTTSGREVISTNNSRSLSLPANKLCIQPTLFQMS